MVSKPIDNIQAVMNEQPATLAMAYQMGLSSAANQTSEEARKKLRVDRLKRSAAAAEAQQSSAVGVALNNPQANEWDKMSSLRQIEMLRDTKKHTLLEKVLKESMSCKQTVDVVTG